MKLALAALVLGTTLAAAACEAADTSTEPDTAMVLSDDSVTLNGPTCATEISLSGITREQFRGWSIEGTDVLGFATVGSRTGTVGWMYEGIVGRAPGTARLIATDAAGATRSVHVRVLDVHRPHVRFAKDTSRIAVGDTAFLPVDVSGECGQFPFSGFMEMTLYGDTSRSNVYASDPQVLQLLRIASASRRMVGWKPGTVRVFTKFWGAQDTAVVIVR